MLITRFERLSPRQVLVTLERDHRNQLAEVRDDVRRVVHFQDTLVKLTALLHPKRDGVLGFEFEYTSAQVPATLTAWSIAVFFRNPRKLYPRGRNFRTVYDDNSLILLKYGKKRSDYLLVGRNPPAEDRKSDVRFATIPEPHPIEQALLP